ncbi:MAG: hypothetical protein Q8K75_07680 [Chlamydiales bacterium]|nr:hypothetical protein [Chlamydiales bacterium]
MPTIPIEFTSGSKRYADIAWPNSPSNYRSAKRAKREKPGNEIYSESMLSSCLTPPHSPPMMPRLGSSYQENIAPTLDVTNVLTQFTTPKRHITTEIIGGRTLNVATPRSVITPKRKVVENPKEDWPDCFIEVQRNTDGSANITCPEKWKNLGYLIYVAISEDGRILIGRTDDLEARLAGYQQELTDGKRSLGEAWLQGKRVFVAPLHLCSSYETARQNETSYIVAKVAEHNRNRGNGDPKIDFGSPLKNGGGGRLREDHLKPLAEEYRNTLTPITDLEHAEPKRWCQLRYNEKLDYIEVDIPTSWRTVHSALYVFKVVNKLYIGETGIFGPRLSSHLSNTNGHATNSNQRLPKAVRAAIRDKLEVAVGILGVCNPTKLENRKVLERTTILAKQTLVSQGGLNSKLDGPNKEPTSPLYELPSPDGQRYTATYRPKRTLKCKLHDRDGVSPQKTSEIMSDEDWLMSPSSSMSSDMSSPESLSTTDILSSSWSPISSLDFETDWNSSASQIDVF